MTKPKADVVLLTYRYNKPSYAVTFIDSSGIGLSDLGN
jgi:hypothetical protein